MFFVGVTAWGALGVAGFRVAGGEGVELIAKQDGHALQPRHAHLARSGRFSHQPAHPDPGFTVVLGDLVVEQAFKPSPHVCSDFALSGLPHFPSQAPPFPQQLDLLPMGTHLRHSVAVESASACAGVTK